MGTASGNDGRWLWPMRRRRLCVLGWALRVAFLTLRLLSSVLGRRRVVSHTGAGHLLGWKGVSSSSASWCCARGLCRVLSIGGRRGRRHSAGRGAHIVERVGRLQRRRWPWATSVGRRLLVWGLGRIGALR
jgi:hypothetical protein